MTRMTRPGFNAGTHYPHALTCVDQSSLINGGGLLEGLDTQEAIAVSSLNDCSIRVLVSEKTFYSSNLTDLSLAYSNAQLYSPDSCTAVSLSSSSRYFFRSGLAI